MIFSGQIRIILCLNFKLEKNHWIFCEVFFKWNFYAEFDGVNWNEFFEKKNIFFDKSSVDFYFSPIFIFRLNFSLFFGTKIFNHEFELINTYIIIK